MLDKTTKKVKVTSSAILRLSAFYPLWIISITISLLFILPITHSIIANILAAHTSTPYDRWLRRLTEYAYRPLQCSVLIPLFFLCIAKFPYLTALHSDGSDKSYKRLTETLFIGVTAVIIMTLLTTSSPLYFFNLWNDSNIIYTVGKAMAKGMIPYRDLFERKGILLYFIHAVAYIMSPNSFTGVYLIEILACFFFLLLTYKTVRLFTSRSILFLIPLFGVIIYAAYNTKSGDSAEELCLPLFLYPLYISIKNIKQENDFTYRQLFFCGLCAGAMLWIKFNMLGFFFGWIIIPVSIYIRKRQLLKIWFYMINFMAGIAAITLPWILYFGLHHAITDWLGVYILNSISGTAKLTTFITSYFKHIPEMIHYNFHIFLLALLSICYLLKRKDKLIYLHIFFTFITTYMFLYWGGIYQRYYCIPLQVFYIFSLIPVHQYCLTIFKRLHTTKPYRSTYAALTCCIVGLSVIYAVVNYVYIGFMTYPKEQLPQYKFARIIKENKGKTLLTYKFMDRGFYTFADILPNCKYFFEMGTDPEPQVHYAEQWVADGKADFLVTEDTKLEIPGYTLIATEPLFFEYGKYYEDTVYYLYRRNTLTASKVQKNTF